MVVQSRDVVAASGLDLVKCGVGDRLLVADEIAGEKP